MCFPSLLHAFIIIIYVHHQQQPTSCRTKGNQTSMYIISTWALPYIHTQQPYSKEKQPKNSNKKLSKARACYHTHIHEIGTTKITRLTLNSKGYFIQISLQFKKNINWNEIQQNQSQVISSIHQQISRGLLISHTNPLPLFSLQNSLTIFNSLLFCTLIPL